MLKPSMRNRNDWEAEAYDKAHPVAAACEATPAAKRSSDSVPTSMEPERHFRRQKI